MSSKLQQWEVVYSTGRRLRLLAPHIEGAFTEAWARAGEDVEGIELYGLTLCGISQRKVEAPDPDFGAPLLRRLVSAT